MHVQSLLALSEPYYHLRYSCAVVYCRPAPVRPLVGLSDPGADGGCRHWQPGALDAMIGHWHVQNSHTNCYAVLTLVYFGSHGAGHDLASRGPARRLAFW